VSAVLALPFAGVGLVALGQIVLRPSSAWSAATADAAFVALLAVSGLLLVRWRLLGDALSIPFATVTVLVGLFVVPTTVRLPPSESSFPAALRAVSVALALGLSAYALRLPEVSSRLRPARFMLPFLASAPLLALGLAFSPLAALHAWQWHGLGLVDGFEAAACVLSAAMLLRRGIRAGRVPFVAAATAMLSLAGACAALSEPRLGLKGPWVALPGLFLTVGAATRLVTAGTDVRAAFQRVVRNDLRGRRRWEAAEDALARARLAYQGQRHDVNSMLSGVDGTLLALTTQRDRLAAKDVDRLMAAVREQVQVLRTLLTGSSAVPDPYDLSHLLSTIVAVRAMTTNSLLSEVEADLTVEGHPERVAAIVGNLLTNAATHASGARVLLTAHRRLTSGAGMVEVAVSDDGPGLSDEQLGHALEQGWRADDSNDVPGSGLGLYQCRELIEAEGGSIELMATDRLAPPDRRGLTVRLSIPVSRTSPPVKAPLAQ
jgi:signal transduction histidine kinase